MGCEKYAGRSRVRFLRRVSLVSTSARRGRRVPFVTGLGVFWFTVLPGGSRAETWPEYQPQPSFQLPSGADVFDVLVDGRIVVLVNHDVYLEDALRSRSFTLLGSLPDAPPLEFPSFVRISPSGTQLATGDGLGQVGVFSWPALTGRWFAAAHYEAEWFDDRHLLLTGGGGGSVSVLDTQSPDETNPVNPTIIVNKGIPGGATFDGDGNLFVGNGFSDSGPIQTGDIKRFPFAEWTTAWTGGPPLDFVSDGVLVVNVLSAASLGFDARGNLHVGGGDFLGGTEVDFAAVVRSTALFDAAKGKTPVDVADPALVQRLDPDAPNEFDFYSVTFNPVTRELYVQNFGDPTCYPYLNVSMVPAASTWGLLAMSLLLLSVGSIRLRTDPRRRSVRHGVVAR